jgi:flagellar hook-associated protein 3 FlgL
MSWATLGTLALPFHLQRTGVQARSDLARHSHELTTGRVQSAARHLRGDIASLHSVENRLVRIDGFENALRQTVTAFDLAQEALSKVARAGDELADKLVLTAQSVAGPAARTVAAQAARNALEETISAMSLSVAGRSIFSGVHSDRAPLASADALLAALDTEVAGLTTAADVAAALEAFFNDPEGGFETDIYRGGPAAAGGAIDDGQPAPVLPTADDPAIRRQLMSAAMVVLIDNGALTLDQAEEGKLQQRAMVGLMENGATLAALQARVGDAQATLEQRQIRLSIERDRLEVARSDMIGVDAYKAAMAVEQSRVQLESVFAVTARIARLSLTEYLR